jgi:hypothetical protein
MSPYAKLISEMTGSTDDATLALIEELMRSERTALDYLSPGQFRRAAFDAVTDMREMHEAGTLAGYCKALGLTIPAALAAA